MEDVGIYNFIYQHIIYTRHFKTAHFSNIGTFLKDILKIFIEISISTIKSNPTHINLHIINM